MRIQVRDQGAVGLRDGSGMLILCDEKTAEAGLSSRASDGSTRLGVVENGIGGPERRSDQQSKHANADECAGKAQDGPAGMWALSEAEEKQEEEQDNDHEHGQDGDQGTQIV